jgi:PIN domain nuclease of toxin-antitoxin system
MAAKGRIGVHRPIGRWLEEMAEHPLINILPITPEIAATAAQLAGSAPTDPADRIIIATALCRKLKLLTADERIRSWGGIPVI